LQGFATRLVDEHTLEVVVSSQTSITQLFTALSVQNIEIRSLRNKTNRLEELFIRLVGNKGDDA
jgi:ABC-2 type transport system ATP-binding protein